MALRVVVVGQKAWRRPLELAFDGLTSQQAQMAAAVLRYFHDLHLGLTPRMAAGIVLTLETDFLSPSRSEATRGARPETEIWARVFARLSAPFATDEAEDPADAGAQGRRQYTGMVPGAAPFYFVARIVAPLIARACEQLGESFLFSAAAEPAPPSFAQDYLLYAKRLDRKLRILVADSRISDVFWTDRAFTLSRLSRRSTETPGLPDVDAVAAAQLLRLAPELRTKSSPYRSIPRRMTASPLYRPLLHRNEGGVDGIHQTRRLADLPGILKSEFLYAREPMRPLFLDRLLQSGYLALRRPPLREKQRDVLLAGILPRLPEPEEMKRALVKAAWFDAMVRLSVWLQRSGLRRSEFLWIEADPWGRQIENRCLLEELPDLGRTLPEEPNKTYRREFLAGLGWLPGYLDRHGYGRWPAAVVQPGDAVRWAAAAWRGQRDDPRWLGKRQRQRAEVRKTPLDTRAYGTVHVMLFLPRVQVDETPLGSLLYQLGLPLEPGFTASVTWVPTDVADRSWETGWAVTPGRGSPRPLFADENRAGSDLENRIAAALLEIWLETILRELFRDD